MYDRADREFEAFAKAYPNSELVPDAILLQGQCRYQLGNFEGAVALLQPRLETAGRLTDQYCFWLAQAQYSRGDLPAAADLFARLLNQFPNAANRLEASYGEAIARYWAGELPKTIELLSNPTNAFRLAAQQQPQDDLVVRGELLLAEALIAQQRSAEALQPLQRLAGRELKPEARWQQQYLQARAQVGNQNLPEAYQTATNLLVLVAATDSRTNRAESFALNAEILQQLNQPDAALRFYTNNLVEGVPTGYRRQALIQIVQLKLAQNQVEPAIQWLETFLQANAKDTAADAVLLCLGELKLRQYLLLSSAMASNRPPDSAAARTNLLPQIKAHLDRLLTEHPTSGTVGKAHLLRGWCLLQANQVAESQADFKAASTLLPHSQDQAVALFKLGDTLFEQKAFPEALQTYKRLVEEYANDQWAKQSLLDQALYQLIQASFEVGAQEESTSALQQIIAWYPNTFFSEQSLLLVGRQLSRAEQPAAARANFQRFTLLFPNSVLLPEAELAAAQTYIQEGDWANAAQAYDAWVAKFTNNPSLPQVEYDRAWIHSQRGDPTNAVALFTNFVARFPAHPNAPLAQQWVGDFYMNQGDFRNAELQYQLLFQNTNWPPSLLTYEARLMAGRAALARQGYPDAIGYFTNLINDAQCPPSTLAQAYFAYGDALRFQPSREGADALAQFGEAIRAYSAICVDFPTNPLVPLALGAIANCHLQLAKDDPSRYAAATNNYAEVIHLPTADLGTRCEAEVGLGIALEKAAAARPPAEKAKEDQRALDCFLNVLYGNNRRPNEPPDRFWMCRAGLEAARIAESFQRWDLALTIYANLLELDPGLRTTLDGRIARAKEQHAAQAAAKR